MSDDYFATADRMQRDSRVLHDNKCWHNACYLAGYVVEAGLKAIIRADEIARAVHPTQYPHDIPLLVSLVTGAKLITGRGFNSTAITSSKLFTPWHPSRRYQPTLWDDETLAKEFQNTAEYMMEFLSELWFDGVIK
jgi:HEPN domain-containing protein